MKLLFCLGCKAVSRSVGRSDGRAGGRAGGRTDGRPVGRSVGQPAGRSVERSVGRSAGRSGGRAGGAHHLQYSDNYSCICFVIVPFVYPICLFALDSDRFSAPDRITEVSNSSICFAILTFLGNLYYISIILPLLLIPSWAE